MKRLFGVSVILLAMLEQGLKAQPLGRACFTPPAQPVQAVGGTYYPIERPCWLGQCLFGPFWVYIPNPQAQLQR